MNTNRIKINRRWAGVPLALAMVLLAGFGLVRAGVLSPPRVVDLQPDPGVHTAPVDASISITYDQDMDPAKVNPQSFTVHARQTGWLTETLSVVSGTITLDPLNDLHAGELVQVSATTETLSLGGQAPLTPTVWQFSTAPWGGNAAFHENQIISNVQSRDVALGDLDGDGDLDAFTTSCGMEARVYHNDGNGWFIYMQGFSFSACFLDAELGDLDGDGDLDVILVDYWNVGSKVLWNNGDGTFTDSGQSVGTEDCYGELGDLDGDGDLDFVVTSGGYGIGYIRVWLNDRTGIFLPASEFDDQYSHMGISLGDLDGDGDLDAFTTGWNNSYNKVWLNDGKGVFLEAQAIPNANTVSVQLGDLDGDGDLDAYLANYMSDDTDLPDQVWLNNGKGQFTDSGQSLETVVSPFPALGDLDADGDLDVYLSGEPDGAAPDEVWANNGAGAFSLFRIVDENYWGGFVTLGDLDNDGNLDAFIGSRNAAQSYQVYLNGDWTQAEPLPNENVAYAFAQCPEDPDSFYIIGGLDDIGSLPDTYRYNTSTGFWTRLAPVPIAVYGASAACYQGKIYYAGGGTPVTDTLYIYDIATNAWSFDSTLPRHVWGAALGAWDGKLFLVGGTDEVFGPGLHPVNQVDVYDIATHTWTADALPLMPIAASVPGYDQAGPYLYLVGGYSGNYNFNVTATQRLDLSTGQWETGPTFSSARASPATALTEQHLYASGGEADGAGWLDSSSLVEVLDLSDWPNGSWQLIGDDLPYPTQGNMSNACTEVGSGGEIWSVGGMNGTPWDIYDTNLYYPTEPCFGNTFALDLAPVNLPGSGLPGETVTYLLTLTNTGDIPDAYNLDLYSIWPAEITGVPGALDVGENRGITVTVQVPPGSLPGEMDVATFNVTSQGDPSQTASAILTTTALTLYAPEFNVEVPALSGDPGTTVVYTLTLSNLGNITDTFELGAAGNLWEVQLPFTQTTLGIGESVEVIVQVAIPPEAQAGEQDSVTLIAASQGDPTQTASAELITTAKAVYGVQLAGEVLALSGDPGTTVVYTLTLSNQGNITDTFEMGAAGNLWEVQLPFTQTTLGIGESVEVIVQVAIPPEAQAGEQDSVTLTATSQGDPAQTASAELITTAKAVYAVQLAGEVLALSGHPGETLAYVFTVANLGNLTDTFDLTFEGNLWPVSLPFTSTTLGVGESLEILIQVSVPFTALAGEEDVLTLTVRSQGDPAQADSAFLTSTAVWHRTLLPVVWKD